MERLLIYYDKLEEKELSCTIMLVIEVIITVARLKLFELLSFEYVRSVFLQKFVITICGIHTLNEVHASIHLINTVINSHSTMTLLV